MGRGSRGEEPCQRHADRGVATQVERDPTRHCAREVSSLCRGGTDAPNRDLLIRSGIQAEGATGDATCAREQNDADDSIHIPLPRSARVHATVTSTCSITLR